MGFIILAFSPALAEELPPDLIERTARKIDRNLIIKPQDLSQRIEKGEKVMVVDVRTRELFEQAHLPGSLNIPLYFIKTKSFLKGIPLILMDRGDQYTQLERESKVLKQSGFDVLILYGGFNAWFGQGYPVGGTRAGGEDIHEMTPQAFFAERNYDHWLVLDLTESQETVKLIPYAVSVKLSSDSARFNKQIKQAEQDNPDCQIVLMIDEDGKNPDRAQSVISQSRLKNVYYLSTGLAGYKKFLQKMGGSRNREGHKPKRITTAAKRGGCGGS